VRVCYPEGDDSLIALGHHNNPGVVIAAFQDHSILDCGLAGIDDDPDLATVSPDPNLLRQTWAVDTNNDPGDWSLEWTWIGHPGNPITADTPGAFPITVWLG
jgi:hypothetical protein